LQDPAKFTQIEIFGLKIFPLATLDATDDEHGVNVMIW
jgi:hypothetical protein